MNILDDDSSARVSLFMHWCHVSVPPLRRALGWFIMIGFPWFFMGFCVSFVVALLVRSVS